MKRPVLLALVAAALASSGTASANDPEQLFLEGQHAAAAAIYEQRWRASSDPVDGVNAVIGWRTAGAYAHARTLLRALRATKLPDDIAERAALIEARLATLTGSARLQGDGIEGASVIVDGGEPERLEAELLLDVGRRRIAVDKPGCERFEWVGVVRPRQRIDVPVKLVCRALPGSLHVTLSVPGAHLRIDDRWRSISDRDYAESLPAGRHEVVVRRMLLDIHRESFDLTPEASKAIDVTVPWRARLAGLTLSGAGHAITATNGVTAGTGLGLGVFRALDDQARSDALTMELQMLVGVATTSVGTETPGPRLWLGMVAGFRHFLPPLWSTRAGRLLLVLDFEPALGTFQGAPTTRRSAFGGADDVSRVLYVGASPVTFTADLPWLHGELAFWPIGLVSHTPYSFLAEAPHKLTHATGLGLTIGDVFFGR